MSERPLFPESVTNLLDEYNTLLGRRAQVYTARASS